MVIVHRGLWMTTTITTANGLATSAAEHEMVMFLDNDRLSLFVIEQPAFSHPACVMEQPHNEQIH